MDATKSRLQLKRGVSFRYHADRDVIAIGIFPPRSIEIDRPPYYLPALLTAWSQPATIDEIWDKIDCVRNSDTAAVVHDLLTLGVLQPIYDIGRYDRHQLYFDFFNVARDDYIRILAERKIGIIGTGGIGSTAALLLTAAGIGALVVSDGDRIEESNLTRSILFDEEDIGELKVLAAHRKLQARNGSVLLSTGPGRIDGVDFVKEHFEGCDLLLLSADNPPDVHSWVNAAAFQLEIPYTTAAYIETHGSIGPLIVPGYTGCFECGRLNGDEPLLDAKELNERFQAPSYGPLNALVSSIAANEILRYLLGLPLCTLGRQLVVNSATYSARVHYLKRNEECSCCTRATTPLHDVPATVQSFDRFQHIAAEYGQSRDTTSLNALILDGLVLEKVTGGEHLRILDVGCGTGTISLALSERGHHVTAIDSSRSMMAQFRARIAPIVESRVVLVERDVLDWTPEGRFDRILLNLVLDHIGDPEPLLRRLREWIVVSGRMVVVLPHPLKDSGSWEKRRVDGEWRYEQFVLTDYFYEGEIVKSREDNWGNVTIASITSHKRTLETYFRMLTSAGFIVDDLIEPRPTGDQPIPGTNWVKSSRIPYFLIACCSGRDG